MDTDQQRITPPIHAATMEAILADMPSPFVNQNTTELQAGFMLGIQHAIIVMKRHADGGTR